MTQKQSKSAFKTYATKTMFPCAMITRRLCDINVGQFIMNEGMELKIIFISVKIVMYIIYATNIV